MFKRRRSALAVLALAAAAVFVLPASSASAASAFQPNACANSVTANFSQVGVTTSGDDGLTTVPPGGATTTTGLGQQAAIPGAIFVAGYNLGLLVVGPNNIPANVNTKIQGTNTTQNIQTSNTVGGTPPNGSVTVSTTITDPDGTPGTGDETATDASFSVTYNNMSWTAGASGTINYRQAPIPDPGGTHAPTAANNSLLINALVGGVFNVQFRCAPGTVLGENPGVITLEPNPAAFDTTDIVVPDTAPTANAGPDQTVNEGDLVTLDGTASSDPEGEALTYNWTAPAGITLSDPTSATPTFTAPQVSADTPLTFTLEVCDEANPAVLCSDPDDTVVVTVLNVDQPPVADAGNDQTVTEGDLVTLNGTGSSDPDGEALTYAWTAPAGITLTGADTASPTFTAPQVDADTPFTFTLEVCDEANPAVLCDTDTVVVTVLNIGASTISIDNASATEGSPENFTVTLSAPQAGTVTVDFATANNTAVAPDDYTAASGTVTFAPGDTSEPVTVQTIDDNLVEGLETFAVNLSNATGNATIGDATGVGTIIDNDQPTISINDASATEGGAENFTVSLNQASTQTVTVAFATANGTAVAPGDYTAASGTLTFAPGVTSQPVTVSTNTDNLIEGTETFSVNLSNPTNATIADGTGTGEILDGTVDQPPVSNAGPDQTVTSGATVTLNGTGSSDPNGEALTYMWSQTAGPAVTLSDPTSPTPTFTAPTVAAPTDLTFSLDVCDEANPDSLCSDPDDTVTIHVQPIVIDATGIVIVNGPVSSTKTSKSFVFKVTNLGMTPITINQSNISSTVDVNGTETGSVTVNPFTKTLNPGASTRVKLSWSYAAGSLATGNTVDFHACVNVTGDIDTTNDCDDETATAK